MVNVEHETIRSTLYSKTVPWLSPIHKKDRNCDLFAVKITACTTFTSCENVLNTSCYFYLPRIFYEWKYTITWLLWNATSRDANIVVKLTYFRYDRLRSTKTHIIIMTTMSCHIRASNDECRVIGSSISDRNVRELLHFIFDAVSVVFK